MKELTSDIPEVFVMTEFSLILWFIFKESVKCNYESTQVILEKNLSTLWT